MLKLSIILLVCLVLVMGVIGFKVFVLWYEPAVAYTAAEDQARKLLIAPASAGFPHAWDGKAIKVDETKDGYHVEAWVEAQNKFGAKLRSPWSCDVKKSPAGVWGAEKCDSADRLGLWREESAPARPAPSPAR